MKDNRLDFLKKSASLAAAFSVGGFAPALALPAGKSQAAEPATFAKDPDMQRCEAYFFGMEEQKIALTKQLEIAY